MNLPRGFEERSRGWLPEEPKTSKRKLKRICASVAVLLSTAVLLSLFSSAFFVQLMTPSALIVPPYTYASASSPFSTCVKFKSVLSHGGGYSIIDGVRQELEPMIHIIFTNGSSTNSRELEMTFSTTTLIDNECKVHLAFKGDNFFYETTMNGKMSDGKLTINSTPSIFMIDPELLVTEKEIQLGETADWRLIGNVSDRRKLPTAIDDYRVQVVSVELCHSTENVPKDWLRLTLGYDPDTGLLTYAAGTLSDILLSEIGVKLIISSMFQMVSYSENLNLQLIKPPLISSGFIFFMLLISLPVATAIIAVIVFTSRRKRTPASMKPTVRRVLIYPEKR
ncbi:MAG: hypothetical protein NWE95_10295 [Candidatus Bathyarchaeota archaeon]|nr:hypothetical protein [Candidatus Bathyarchaeota archaeon]